MGEAARSVIMQHMGWCLMSDVRSPTELKTWMRLRSKDGVEIQEKAAYGAAYFKQMMKGH
jgi:hypothetical protein